MSLQQVRVELDSNVRQVCAPNGIALIGGDPFRVIRLSRMGAQALHAMVAGEPAASTQESRKLRDRLVAASMLHPVPEAPVRESTEQPSRSQFAVVIPVFEDAVGLGETLAGLRAHHCQELVVVVDDASSNSAEIAAVAERHGAVLIRHDINRGPAAARNTGWRAVLADSTGEDPGELPEAIVFLDADVVPTPGSLNLLLSHLGASHIAGVASRVLAKPGAGAIAIYEAGSSPLDLGENPAVVRPGSRLAYVPSAALAVRTSALAELEGFAEDMRVGEDVDFVWRLFDQEQAVRYEPRSVARHRSRGSLMAFARQRFGYGSSAADLGVRHREKIAPLQLPAPVLASTAALALGIPLLRTAAVAGAAASAIRLRRTLDGAVDDPTLESLRLSAMSHRFAAEGLANAATRTWAPLLLFTRRSRRVWLVALVVPALIDWIRDRPANDPLRHVGLRAVDHSAYCAGVWAGVWRQRSTAALLPHVLRKEREDQRKR